MGTYRRRGIVGNTLQIYSMFVTETLIQTIVLILGQGLHHRNLALLYARALFQNIMEHGSGYKGLERYTASTYAMCRATRHSYKKHVEFQ